MDPHKPRLPTWAPRVKQHLIRRLYETDARGIHDDELMDDVGLALYARCLSFIAAVEASRGRAACPACGEIIQHDRRPETLLHCPACGWEATWRDYFGTLQHKQLSGADEVLALFQDFASHFPTARTPQEKMLLIDRIIHGFHHNLVSGPRRTTGVNLIEGNYHEVVDFLDSLTYGDESTPGTQETWQDWRNKMNYTADTWGDERLRRP